jgi:serine/threonine protein kinase
MNSVEADEYSANALKLEISIHKSFNHPNIVKVADIIQTSNNYYIIQEFCSGGNLRKVTHLSVSSSTRNPTVVCRRQTLSTASRPSAPPSSPCSKRASSTGTPPLTQRPQARKHRY